MFQMAGMERSLEEKEEERPSFFKVLADEYFSDQLRLPPTFVKKFIPYAPRICGLRGPCGNWWAVELEEIENRLVFRRGWEGFVKHHCLELGDFLTFTYDGVSKFDVIIYGNSYCEKNLEAAKRRIDNSLGDRKRTRNHAIPGKRAKLPKKGKRARVGQTVKHPVLDPISFKSGNPTFQKEFTEACRYEMKIPKEVVIDAGIMGSKTILVRDPAGKNWTVDIHEISTDGRMRMLKGWSLCHKANQISIGDMLIFECVKQCEFQLHICKKASMN